MAPNTRLYTVALNAALDAVGITALLAGGQIQIYTGAQPAVQGALTGTKLSTLTFGSPALGAASGGVATANAITQDSSAANTGTAGYFALTKSDGTTVVATGSVGTSGANMNLATLSINAGDVVTCSSLTLTIPAQGA
jgi:hypothetical protein